MAHIGQDVVGDAVGLDALLLGGEKALADIALKLFDELREDVGVHAGVAHGLFLRSGRRGRHARTLRRRARSSGGSTGSVRRRSLPRSSLRAWSLTATGAVLITVRSRSCPPRKYVL